MTTLTELFERGFDNSEVDEADGTVRVKCSACEALVINGTPCHETGCTNKAGECFECGAPIPGAGNRYRPICDDCGNPDPDWEEVVSNLEG
jgi:hypothetical protein